MFSAKTKESSASVAQLAMRNTHAQSMAPDMVKDANNRSARVGLPLGSISQVTLISLVTLDALSHASYAYDAYECTFPLSLVSAGQVVSPERHLPVG